MNRFYLMIIISVCCLCRMGMSKQVRDDRVDEHDYLAVAHAQTDGNRGAALTDSFPVPHAQTEGNRRAILTSLLLGALAAANPSLTNTLLLTNPYLAAYFVPPPPRGVYPPAPPIYGYTAINPFQDSSAFGNSYKRELKQ